MEASGIGRVIGGSEVRILLIVLCALIFCCAGTSYAEETSSDEKTYQEVADSLIGEVKRARVSSGIVRSIDLDTRTGIIGGHKYWFAQPYSEYPLKVYLNLYGGGSLELVQPGMKVEITYGETGNARLAMIVRQLQDDAEIDH
jgi:hypothetical protein